MTKFKNEFRIGGIFKQKSKGLDLEEIIDAVEEELLPKVLTKYDPTEVYVEGDIVVSPIDGKTYQALADIEADQDPIDFSDPTSDPYLWKEADIDQPNEFKTTLTFVGELETYNLDMELYAPTGAVSLSCDGNPIAQVVETAREHMLERSKSNLIEVFFNGVKVASDNVIFSEESKLTFSLEHAFRSEATELKIFNVGDRIEVVSHY